MALGQPGGFDGGLLHKVDVALFDGRFQAGISGLEFVRGRSSSTPCGGQWAFADNLTSTVDFRSLS